MRVTRLVSIEDCAPIFRAWDCMAHGNPFRSTAWLTTWWNHFGENRELCVLQVTNPDGAIVGLAPWYIESSMRLGNVVRPLGSGEVCSEYLGVLATFEYESQVANVLADWLVRAGQGELEAGDRWDVLELTSVDSSDHLTRRLAQRLEDFGCQVHGWGATECWRLELPNDWEEYLSLLSHDFRKRVRQFARNWLDSGKAKCRKVSNADDLQQGMRILVDLHQRRREGLGQSGCFSDPTFCGFLHEAAEKLLEQNLLDLIWLEVEGRPVAAEFQMAGRGWTFAYQSGIEPDLLSIQPGHLIQTALFRDYIDRGCCCYDYLRGAEDYKKRWRAKPHRCVNYRVAPGRTSARMRHQMWLAGDTMKQWLKSGLHVAGIN